MMTNNQYNKLSNLFQEVKKITTTFNHAELKEYMAVYLEDYKLSMSPNDFFIQVITTKGISKESLQNYLGKAAAMIEPVTSLAFENKQFTLQVDNWQEFKMDSFQKNTIALIIIAAQKENNIGILDFIEVLSEGLPYVKIYSDINWSEQPDTKRQIEEGSGILQLETLTELINHSIEKDAAILANTSVFAGLSTFKEWHNIKQLKNLIGEKADSIKFMIAAKKQEIEQNLQKNQKKDFQKLSDIQEIKKRIHNRLQQFDVRTKEYLDHSFSPTMGNLIKKYHHQINTLQFLEEAKGGKNIRYLINENFLNTFLNNLRGDITKVFTKEKETTLSFAKSVETETSHFLNQRNLPMPTKLGQIIDETRLKQALKVAISFEKRFEKNASDRKAMEYFMGARLYYMMIFMGLSMFGLSGLVQKIKLYMIPIGILLVGLGIYQVWSSQQKEADERKIKNLEDAHNYLKNQTKKILQEASKVWDKEVSTNLKQEINRFLETIEQSLQLNEKREKLQKEQEKDHFQHILDGLKQQEKTFDSATRNNNMINSKFDRLKTETSNELTKAISKLIVKT